MANDSPYEIEQWFLPKPEFAKEVRESADAKLKIIQGYLPREPGATLRLTPNIRFKMDGHQAEHAIIEFSVANQPMISIETADPIAVGGLHKLDEGHNTAKLLQNMRFRCQKNAETKEIKLFLTFKNPLPRQEPGLRIAEEYEFEIPQEQRQNAIRLMIDYCADHLLRKTRYKKAHVIDGKPRTLELDDFKGIHKGKTKLEIEHRQEDDVIPEVIWKPFAERDITGQTEWTSYTLAHRDEKATAKLEKWSNELGTPLRIPTSAAAARTPA